MNTRARGEVAITGIGLLSPIGDSVPDLLASLRDNRSGISAWESPETTKVLPAGIIAEDFSTRFTKLELPYLDRVSQLALIAAGAAMRDAGIEQFGDFGQRAGLYYGSVAGGVKTQQDWVKQFYEGTEVSRPYTIMTSMLNAAPVLISIKHKIKGPVLANSSACSSSGVALGEAYRAIRDGYLDIAVAGGAEAALTPTFMGLWRGLRALAEPDPQDISRSCKPFSEDRTGLVVSEGAVFFMLESMESARRRGASCYALLSGFGIASDAHHIGSPHPDGQAAAMRAALSDAGLAPCAIAYYNAHATATRGGDRVETAAIREVFGAHTDRLPVSSTKAIHGHLLGAASAIELAVSALAIRASFLPATAHLERIDPECSLKHVANRAIGDTPLEHAMSLSAGFGGTNVALIASKAHDLATKPLEPGVPPRH